jgi:hypothetical protein
MAPWRVLLFLLLLPLVQGCGGHQEGGLQPIDLPPSGVMPFPQLFWTAHGKAWADVGQPVEYDIEIARDEDFRQVVDVDKVPLTRYVPDRPLEPGEYHWRVRARPAGSESEAWSEPSAFVISAPEEVVIVDYDPAAANHQPAVQEAVDRAVVLSREGKSVEVRFPPGTYLGSGAKQFILLEDAKGLILNGDGVKVQLEDWNMGATRIERSRNVLVRGFTFDHQRQLPFLQARVTAVDAGKKEVTVVLEGEGADYDDEHVKKGMSTFSLLDPEVNGRLKAGAPNFYPKPRAVRSLGGRRYVLELDRAPSGIAAGDRLVQFLRTDACSLFSAVDAVNVTYYGLTSHSASGGHYVGVSTSMINVLHCRSDISGNRWFGGNADGVHMRANPVGPWVESTVFNGIGDDGVAIYARPVRARVTWPDDRKNALIVTREFFDWEPGDALSFFEPQEGRIFFETTVESITPQGQDFLVTLAEDVPRRLSFGASLLDDDQIWNRSKSGGDFMIRRCRFSNIRRFGVVFRSAGGVVEDCVFEGTSSSGLLFINETQYPNGLYCSEIIIRNNTFKECGFDSQPLGLMAFDFRRRGTGNLAADQGPRRVLLENNKILAPAPGRRILEIASAKDFVIRGNTVTVHLCVRMTPTRSKRKMWKVSVGNRLG